MSDVAIGRVTAAIDGKARAFLVGLLIVSVVPAGFLAYAYSHFVTDYETRMAGKMIFLIGTSHVALTGFFWFDCRYREHINERPRYYYALPAAIAATWMLATQISGQFGNDLLFAGFFCWLLYHYGRQNWGLVCLTAAGTRSGPPSLLERRICAWAPAAGIVGLAPNMPPFAGGFLGDGLFWAGGVATLGVSVAAVAVAAAQYRSGVGALRPLVTILVGAFFLPGFFLGSVGINAVGMAHSYQYAFIIGCLAASQKGMSIRLWGAPLIALSMAYIALGLGVSSITEGPQHIAQAVAALWASVTIWHFLIDADVWRLRQPFQRQALRDSLPFLFR